jgi:pimeloyl-ACP methyl ester carboxylesterase
LRKLLTKRNIILAVLALILITAATITYQFLHKDYRLYHSKNIALDKGAATYVLVPGGGHGAWCYEQVETILKDAGQIVYAVPLPGVGERADELTFDTDLDDHIDAVVSFVEENDLHDIFLVGHSYGGMVITGVADRIPDRIKNIVYLDAVHPADGQNLLDAQPLVKYVPVVGKPIVVNGVEVNLYPNDETIAFLGLTDDDDITLAKQYLTPHPWRTFTQKLHLKSPDIVEEVGKTDIYTKTTLDGLRMAGIVSKEECKNAMVIDTGHDLMITEPELTANMLLNAAERLQ